MGVLKAPARDDNPVWSPDGKNIVFTSSRVDLYIKPADGSGEEKLQTNLDWTRDGRFLVFDSTARVERISC